MRDYIKKIELINKILLIGIVIVWVTFYLINTIAIKKYNKTLIENAKLQQQVIDYKWQLEQVEDIIKCKGDN